MTLEELAYGLAPQASGLYILYDQDGNFYYGSAVNLRFRLQNHLERTRELNSIEDGDWKKYYVKFNI